MGLFATHISDNIYKSYIYQIQVNSKKPNNPTEKWAEDPNTHFPKERQTDGQQVLEKMLNTTNHQGNANQNHNEILPPTCPNDYNQKDKK